MGDDRIRDTNKRIVSTKRAGIVHGYQRNLAAVFTALALLVLIAGSFALGHTILTYAYFGNTFHDGLVNFACALFAAWVCATVALLMLRRINHIIVLAAFTIAAWFATYYTLFLIGAYAPVQVRSVHESITPLHDLPAVLIVALFVMINALALYGVWRFVVRDL